MKAGVRMLAGALWILTAGLPAAAGPLDEAAANRWVSLPGEPDVAGYDLARPVFAADRGQLLQWGGVMARWRTKATPRNDVRAFDPAAGRWVSDYAIAEKCPYPPAGQGAAPRGTSYYGSGEMLPAGTPWPSVVVAGLCYDSKRDKVYLVQKGLMAAYDPKARTWSDMKAKCVLDGREYPGGPPAYAPGVCYDPVNDEILYFPHYSGGEPFCRDSVAVTGGVSSHLGTFRYSFADNTWRRVSDTFGGADLRKQRADALARMAELSRQLDAKYAKGPHGDVKTQGQAPGFSDSSAEPPRRDQKNQVPVPGFSSLSDTAAQLRDLQAKLDGELRVEPPPRCGAPMVYDPKNQAICLFGGQSGLVRADLHQVGGLGAPPGGLNDTWVYDCRTRQWREIKTDRRPPVQRVPMIDYDPASGLVVLVTFAGTGRTDPPARTTLWTLDVAAGRWQRRGEQDFPVAPSFQHTYANSTPLYNVGLDAKAGVLVFCQNVVEKGVTGEQVVAMKLDVGKLPAEEAPTFEPDPPIRPQVLPPDDPAWVAKLKELPANTWTLAKPQPYDAAVRDWGNAACDPVTGFVWYFGGGHATYQVRDVAIYQVGANRWVHAAGDHNDFIPPVGWGGMGMGYRGGVNAHHQRNQYVAFDGRMVVSVGGWAKINSGDTIPRGREAGPRLTWFYDQTRGGVWRRQQVARIERAEGVDGVWSDVHVATPDGRILGLTGDRTSYYGADYPSFYVSIYDVYANTLQVRSVPKPFPMRVPECRPFCYVPDRDQVFYYEFNEANKRQVTWVYDLKTNRFIDLKPAAQPPGMAFTVEYMDDQKAVWANVTGDRQWVYSFEKDTWAPFATEGPQPRFTHPYGQVVYSAKYGVLVFPRPPLAVLRPDVAKVKWE